jgi:hypothetical protein
MNWKKFLKPDKRKITIAIAIYIIIFFLGQSQYPLSLVSTILMLPFFILFTGGMYYIQNYILYVLFLILLIMIFAIYLYIISCFIIWIFDKLKKKK